MPKIDYQRIVIDLSDAGIKALPGTPKLLLPAPGVGKLLWPHSALLLSKFAGGAYEDAAGSGSIDGYLVVTHDPSKSTYFSLLEGVSGMDALSIAADSPTILSPPTVAQGASGFTLSDYENKPLYLALVDRSGNTNPLQGGGINNSLRLILDYDFVTL